MPRRRTATTLALALLVAMASAAPSASAISWYPSTGASFQPCAGCTGNIGMAADGTTVQLFESGPFGGPVTATEYPPGDLEGLRSAELTGDAASNIHDFEVNAAGDAIVGLYLREAGSTEEHFGTIERRNGVWRPFRAIPGIPQGAGVNVRVALADDGRAAVAWHEFAAETPFTVRAATRTAAGTWSAPTTLGAGGQPEPPQVAVDAAGRTTVAWIDHQDAPEGAVLRAAQRSAAGSWSATQAVGGETFGAGAPEDPFDLALASRGSNATLAMVIARDAGLTSRLYSTQLASGTWSAPALHDEDGPNRIGVDANAAGTAVATWRGGGEVRTMRAPAGQGFGAAKGVPAESSAGIPAVAVAGDGSALVAWEDHRVVNTVWRSPGGVVGPVQAIPQQRPVGGVRVAADADGHFAVSTYNAVRLSARSRPPVAIAEQTAPSDLLTDRGEEVTLSAARSFDPDRPDAAAGGIASRAWDLDGDGAYDDASGATARWTFDTAGVHVVAVRVLDNAGDARVGRVGVGVQPLRPEVLFSVTPASPLTQEPVTLTSTTTTPGTQITAWQWETTGPFPGYDDATGATAQTTYAVPGTYLVGLQVMTAENGLNAATRALFVGNRSPVADYLTSGSPVPQGLVEFDASASSDPDPPPGVGIRRFEWDLDGNGDFETDQGTAPQVLASYAAPGTVDVGLRVTDAFGGTASTRRPLGISRAAEPSSAATEKPPARTVAGVAKRLAAGSRDVAFTAHRAGVLGARFEARGSRRLLAASATVFRRSGTQVLRVPSTRALRRARTARIRVTWTPRGGRAVTATRTLRRAR